MCAWISRCRVCSWFDHTLLLFPSNFWDELVCFPMQLCGQVFVERLCYWLNGCWLPKNWWDVVRCYFQHHKQIFQYNCHKHAVWFFSPYVGVAVPGLKNKWVFFKLNKINAGVVVEVYEYRNIIYDKQGGWCVRVEDFDNVFRVWNEFTFDGNFRNRKVLV